jgi:peptidoglycan/xylan/chitin deacetylase (PgdA/CDA1 family)
MIRFPILMYHRIESGECPVIDRDERRYAVSFERFSRQLKQIESLELRSFTVSEAVDAMRAGTLPARSIVITFDDGNRSDAIHALPLLRTRGLRATFYINVDNIGKPDGLDVLMIRRLAQSGMEIGSHGMTHRFLTTLPEAEVRTECETSREALSGITGEEIRSFAPPGGRIHPAALRILKECSYDSVCNSRIGFNTPGSDPFRLRRFPVMAGTGDKTVTAILERDRMGLVPLFARAQALWLARIFLGEQIYNRSRSKALWD